MNTTTLAVPMSLSMRLLERGLLPDFLVRIGIRRLLASRLAEEDRGGPVAQQRHLMKLIARLRQSPIAINTADANLQHYELPSGFFELVLGKHLKYSCGYYQGPAGGLDEAEAAMLALTAERARLRDGDRILELGCGWGSLSLWMAERYPNSRITAVSNSRTQKSFIDARATSRGLENLEVITCDVNRLSFPDGTRFDRVVSVEMFEHMRNYEILLARIASWLKPNGKLFVHIFAHKTLMYPFETAGDDNWMGRHFFTGGLMPASDTLLWFQRDLRIEQRWHVDGTHYQRTADHWLANQDAHRERVMATLIEAYGTKAAPLWFQRWRMFWMACAEMFGYDRGQEWLVAHYRFVRP